MDVGCGRRTLERLDERRVVVALDLEGDRPALADVDDAGVLAEHGRRRRHGGRLPASCGRGCRIG